VTFHYVILLKYNNAGTLVAEENIDIQDHYHVGQDNFSAFGLEKDASGNIYVGYSYYESSNDFDIKLAKYNSALTQQWEYTFKPGSEDLGVDMKVTSSGMIYAVVKSTTGSSITYHIINTDAAGVSSTPLYSFDTDLEQINRIILDPNQNIYVTGSRLVSGFTSLMTASVDPTGLLRWKNVNNGGSSVRNDYGSNLIWDITGCVYVIGTSDRGIPRGKDMMIVKLTDYSGKQSWQSFQDHLNNHDYGLFLKAVTSNDLIIAGSSGNSVVMIRLLASSGLKSGEGIYQPVPSTSYLSVDEVTLTDFAITPSRNLYLTGFVQAINSSTQDFNASFLARYNLILHTRGTSSIKFDFAESVEGDFNSNEKGTAFSINLTGSSIYWIRDHFSNYINHQTEFISVSKYNVTAPARFESMTTDNNIAIFPNPSNTDINISSDENIRAYEVFDFAGRMILEQQIDGYTSFVKLSKLESGVYLIRVHLHNGKTFVDKIFQE
jgi:hypothetical protein